MLQYWVRPMVINVLSLLSLKYDISATLWSALATWNRLHAIACSPAHVTQRFAVVVGSVARFGELSGELLGELAGAARARARARFCEPCEPCEPCCSRAAHLAGAHDSARGCERAL